MGHANVIWQGDANDIALRALRHTEHPMTAYNLSGPAISIRQAALGLAQRLGTQPHFEGVESPTAWLVDCARMNRVFGPPRVNLETLLDWTADWVREGKPSLDKPTHFEVRDGHY